MVFLFLFQIQKCFGGETHRRESVDKKVKLLLNTKNKKVKKKIEIGNSKFFTMINLSNKKRKSDIFG